MNPTLREDLINLINSYKMNLYQSRKDLIHQLDICDLQAAAITQIKISAYQNFVTELENLLK